MEPIQLYGIRVLVDQLNFADCSYFAAPLRIIIFKATSQHCTSFQEHEKCLSYFICIWNIDISRQITRSMEPYWHSLQQIFPPDLLWTHTKERIWKDQFIFTISSSLGEKKQMRRFLSSRSLSSSMIVRSWSILMACRTRACACFTSSLSFNFTVHCCRLWKCLGMKKRMTTMWMTQHPLFYHICDGYFHPYISNACILSRHIMRIDCLATIAADLISPRL